MPVSAGWYMFCAELREKICVFSGGKKKEQKKAGEAKVPASPLK